MIFAVGKGRAGNLMFQLGAIESVLKKSTERIFLINFSNLEEVFPSLGKHVRTITLSPFVSRIFPWIDSAFRRLAKARVIGSVIPVVSHPTAIRRLRGALPITCFWGGFCQDEKLMSWRLLTSLYREDIALPMRGKSDSKNGAGRSLGRRCFVHVRRGDYVDFPSPEHSAVLPHDWYLAQMIALREELGNMKFAIFSDEPQWAREHLASLPDVEVMELSPRDSFAMMSTSQAGILSPSTFSWWAAYFASRNSPGPFIAPYLWTGWRSGHWDPHEKIAASFLRFAPVDRPSA